METVGNYCREKRELCIRIMIQHVNGIGQKSNSIKEKSLNDLVVGGQVDIMGIQETHVCWSKGRHEDRLNQMFKNWKETCSITTVYNS